MTLGELIEFLEKRDPAQPVAVGFEWPHSYRGYYDQLAFRPVANTTVGAMLAAARSALGMTYDGYKGGEYTMDEHTECWLANYGTTSPGDNLGPVLLHLMVGEVPDLTQWQW